MFAYHTPHTVTTAVTIIPSNDTKIVGMPITMTSLGPPGVPVVSLAVAAEDKKVNRCLNLTFYFFLGQVITLHPKMGEKGST